MQLNLGLLSWGQVTPPCACSFLFNKDNIFWLTRQGPNKIPHNSQGELFKTEIPCLKLSRQLPVGLRVKFRLVQGLCLVWPCPCPNFIPCLPAVLCSPRTQLFLCLRLLSHCLERPNFCFSKCWLLFARGTPILSPS